MVSETINWIQFLEDGLFAAMAAIGFSSISHTPTRVYSVCAIAAAAGHSLRFLLMDPAIGGMNIIVASAMAAFVIGVIAVALASTVKAPAEAVLFPALLPMIPGMYAYRTFGGLASGLTATGELEFMHNLYVMGFNGLTCIAIIFGMVIGANLPIFMLKRISFTATR